VKQLDTVELSKAELAAIENEIALMRGLAHPNIVRYVFCSLATYSCFLRLLLTRDSLRYSCSVLASLLVMNQTNQVHRHGSHGAGRNAAPAGWGRGRRGGGGGGERRC
jgi:hypothetical protein